jgi:hypothetical protein
VQTVAETIEFPVELSKEEREAIKKLISAKTKFEIAKEAVLSVKMLVEVKNDRR